MDISSKYQAGDRYHEFTFTKVLPLEELQLVLHELRHEPTGARVVYLKANDPENLFCLSFQTIPKDSTGVAHILEHTVLCGSKKFPIKDPFFSMSRRSLNTFMNAMTGSDSTFYPAASQVEQDFYNLLEVYLDAVFHPELKKLSFLQEGHRFAFDEERLVYKGVVYNEMKGSLSNPETRLWQEILKYLTPDLTYAVNSGGDPKEIPNLTYEGLKAFHAAHYHPSRCIFYFYGNLPLEKHLDFIAQHALTGVKKVPPLPKLPKQKRFEKPVSYKGYYPAKEGKDYVAFGWLTATIDNQEDDLALALLDSVLMETDASPLKDALLQSKLCTQADGYLDTEMSEFPYVIICRGCEKESTEKLKAIIFDKLKELCAQGISEELIEGALHQLEFSRLEISGDYGPFGLTLFARAILAMQHGSPPENALTIYSQFNKLRLKIKDPAYLSGLIEKYFLHNKHFLSLTFSADPKLEEEEQREEQERLKKIEAKLTDKEKQEIEKETVALEEYQEETEHQSLDCLPTITLADVNKEPVYFPLHQQQLGQMAIFHHDCFTNHIAYSHLLFDLPAISLEDLPYLQLLLSLLPELGAGKRNYKQNLEYINAYLGDFSTSLNFYPQAGNPNVLRPAFGFKGRALNRNLDKLFALFRDVALSPDFSNSARIKELILQIHTSLENRLNRNAMNYATQRCVSTFTESSYIGEIINGLSYFRFIRKIAKEDVKKVTEKFKALYETLSHFTTPHLILSCDKEQYHLLAKEDFFGIDNLPSKSFSAWKGYSLPRELPSEAYTISSPVAFSALGISAAHLESPLSPALSISTNLMENTFLHKKIREQGGAYGASASYNPLSGNYYLSSYRDPHIAPTFKAFEEGIKHISSGKFNAQELIEAKLGVIRDADSPVSPGSRAIVGYAQFRQGLTKEKRQAFRDLLLLTNKNEIKEATEKFLENQNEGRVTFSGESLLNSENPNLTITSL